MSKKIKISKVELGKKALINLGHLEESFLIGNSLNVSLRTLSSSEIFECFTICQPIMDEINEANQTHLISQYYDALRLELLSRSLTKIDSYDFKEVDFVETEDDKGNEITVTKIHFVRELLKSWLPEVVVLVNQKYELIQEKAKDNFSSQVQWETNTEDEKRSRLLELEAETRKLKEDLSLSDNKEDEESEGMPKKELRSIFQEAIPQEELPSIEQAVSEEQLAAQALLNRRRSLDSTNKSE